MSKPSSLSSVPSPQEKGKERSSSLPSDERREKEKCPRIKELSSDYYFYLNYYYQSPLRIKELRLLFRGERRPLSLLISRWSGLFSSRLIS